DNNSVTLANLPPLGDYASYNIYRTENGGSDFFLLDNTTSSTYVDDGSAVLSSQALDNTTLNGNYTYLITFHRDGIEDSRPSMTFGPQSAVDGRIRLSDLPLPPP